jgi:hypothetical protein
MKETSSSIIHAVAIVSAAALTLLLFIVGGRPEAGQIFHGGYHWLAHLGTFWLIAIVYGFALPRLAWPWVGLIVAAIGGIHEFYEISAHGHPMEYPDVAVNALGAFLGALARPALSRQMPE